MSSLQNSVQNTLLNTGISFPQTTHLFNGIISKYSFIDFLNCFSPFIIFHLHHGIMDMFGLSPCIPPSRAHCTHGMFSLNYLWIDTFYSPTNIFCRSDPGVIRVMTSAIKWLRFPSSISYFYIYFFRHFTSIPNTNNNKTNIMKSQIKIEPETYASFRLISINLF